MDKYISNLNKRVVKTMKKQDLLSAGDKILVALSGGKDSMILLDILAECRKYIPIKFELVATHILISNIGYKTDTKYLKEFCEERNVPFILKEFEIDMAAQKTKSECFICSWNRRKALFSLANEINCTKIALGHHMDDSIETLLMNMMYHGRISSMPFKLSMFDGDVEIIRPLLEISEESLIGYAAIAGYKKELKFCPYESTKRSEIKELLKNISRIHPLARKNIFRAADKIDLDYLPRLK